MSVTRWVGILLLAVTPAIAQVIRTDLFVKSDGGIQIHVRTIWCTLLFALS